MPQPGSLISPTERREAREVYFTEAVRRGEVVTISAYQSSDELVFDLAERWVEGTSVEGQRIRLPFDQVRRLDLDFVTQEGDDKTHYYFFLLIASDQDTLVYTERAPERDYSPLPEASPREKAETNLGALARLTRLEGRATFPLSDPDHAFRWGVKQYAEAQGRGSGSGAWDALLTGLVLIFLVFGLYYLILRSP